MTALTCGVKNIHECLLRQIAEGSELSVSLSSVESKSEERSPLGHMSDD